VVGWTVDGSRPCNSNTGKALDGQAVYYVASDCDASQTSPKGTVHLFAIM